MVMSDDNDDYHRHHLTLNPTSDGDDGILFVLNVSASILGQT